eukprot:1138672-Pelagomonas_calceolata.AAC.3
MQSTSEDPVALNALSQNVITWIALSNLSQVANALPYTKLPQPDVFTENKNTHHNPGALGLHAARIPPDPH